MWAKYGNLESHDSILVRGKMVYLPNMPNINSFLKLKQEASGWPSECQDDESKERYLREYEETEGIVW